MFDVDVTPALPERPYRLSTLPEVAAKLTPYDAAAAAELRSWHRNHRRRARTRPGCQTNQCRCRPLSDDTLDLLVVLAAQACTPAPPPPSSTTSPCRAALPAPAAPAAARNV